MPYELPSNSRSPHDGPRTISESAELFRRVAAQDPERLIKEHRFGAVAAAIATANQQRLEETGEEYHGFYGELVGYGYQDIRQATEMLAVGKPVDERLKAAHDPRTIGALGKLADRSETGKDGVLYNNSGHGDRLEIKTDRSGQTYLDLIEWNIGRTPERPGKKVGCPFAAMRQDPLPSKPYQEFAVWASEVAIRLDYLERQYRYAKYMSEKGLFKPVSLEGLVTLSDSSPDNDDYPSSTVD